MLRPIIKSPKEFRRFFLLKFTEELIRHSLEGEVSELKNVLKKDDEEKKQEVKEEKKKIRQIIKNKENQLLTKRVFKPLPQPIRTRPRILKIPSPKLPSRFQYLRPTPTKLKMDLGKLNPLLRDPAVKTIECDGPDENLLVKGTMGSKKTEIILNKEEISQVIKKFSETAKIPTSEGVFRVVAGKLILLAIISEVIGSKFIIKKMFYSPRPPIQRR
jgi:hypothetical protein